MLRADAASIPIRQGGIFANRASTWPRDHFCRSTMAPRRTNDVERVLVDIDADKGDWALERFCHGVLIVFGAPHKHRLLVGRERGRAHQVAKGNSPRD
jgi:hypothetical protein